VTTGLCYVTLSAVPWNRCWMKPEPGRITWLRTKKFMRELRVGDKVKFDHTAEVNQGMQYDWTKVFIVSEVSLAGIKYSKDAACIYLWNDDKSQSRGPYYPKRLKLVNAIKRGLPEWW